MHDITNFNDGGHRTSSASAVFQKGVYHLFMLKNRDNTEVFAHTLRMYQCLFYLCLTQLLLDQNYLIKTKDIPPRLRNLCHDPKVPTRQEIDPAAIITHSVFEHGHWKRFPVSHPLHSISNLSIELYNKVVDARHNLLYRPFMLDGDFWEDCTLIDLLETAPKVDEIEQAYQELIKSILKWQTSHTRYFLQLLFLVYEDHRNSRPTETLLLTYTRMLNPHDKELLLSIKAYRNQLFNITDLLSIIHVPEIWQPGDL